MAHYAHHSVRTLLRRHPWAEEILGWHGLDLSGVNLDMSLEALCWSQIVDVDRVQRDLLAADPSPDRWMDDPWDAFGSLDDDDWTWADEDMGVGDDWDEVPLSAVG